MVRADEITMKEDRMEHDHRDRTEQEEVEECDWYRSLLIN